MTSITRTQISHVSQNLRIASLPPFLLLLKSHEEQARGSDTYSAQTVYLASQLSWTIVDIVCAICVTSLPAINNLLIHHLPRYLSQYWSGGDPGSSPTSTGSLLPSRGLFFSRNTNSNNNSNNSNSERKYSNGTGVSGDETKQIMVQRDIDMESMRTEGGNEHHDLGYLELNEVNSGHRRGNSTFINT